MKGYLFVVFISMLICCKSATKTGPVKVSNRCCDTPDDNGYNKREILFQFGNILSELVPSYRRLDGRGFYAEGECQLSGAFIIDLSDTTNRETTPDECIKFLDGHVYHFAPIRNNNSYSNIAVLAGGNVKLFKAINCPEKGDKLNDVIDFVRRLEAMNDNILLNRIRSYRKYGVYLKIDEQSEFRCK